jgi:hypothetical protein
MAKKCYWCDSPTTSMEHAPPKCIFPVEKDTTDKIDRRLELITVPSCDEHNGAKSQDDEYLLSVLAVCILNNTVGTEQAKSKVLRALENNPKLCTQVLGDYEHVVAEDIATGNREHTVAFKLDHDRIVSVFEHIARALFFHHYGRAWQGNVTSFAEFQMAIGDDAIKINESYEEIRTIADELIGGEEKHGSNPDVFYYQFVDKLEETNMLLFRLTFYEGTCALIKFDSN